MSFKWKCSNCVCEILIEDANSPSEMSPYANPVCPDCYNNSLQEEKKIDNECVIEEIMDNGMPMYITPDGMIFACKRI